MLEGREGSNQPPRFYFVSGYIFRGSEAFALDGEEGREGKKKKKKRVSYADTDHGVK